MYEHVGRMNVRPFQEDDGQDPGQVSLARSCLFVAYQVNLTYVLVLVLVPVVFWHEWLAFLFRFVLRCSPVTPTSYSTICLVIPGTW